MSSEVLRSCHTGVVVSLYRNRPPGGRGYLRTRNLSVPPLKFLHKGHQRLHRSLRHRVIDRSPHPANRPMASQTVSFRSPDSAANFFSTASSPPAMLNVTFIFDRETFSIGPE